jgi:putative methyltransferase
MLNDTGVTNSTVLHQDFLKENTVSKDYSKIEFALVDPPCSGSGMVKRSDFLQEEEVDENRIASLANLQSMLLKVVFVEVLNYILHFQHALRMPNLKRLVYSTCSIHEKENEGVIDEVLQEQWVTERFELIDPMDKWKNRGIGDYGFAGNCLRSDPGKDLTNGFFVALFQAKA